MVAQNHRVGVTWEGVSRAVRAGRLRRRPLQLIAWLSRPGPNGVRGFDARPRRRRRPVPGRGGRPAVGGGREQARGLAGQVVGDEAHPLMKREVGFLGALAHVEGHLVRFLGRLEVHRERDDVPTDPSEDADAARHMDRRGHQQPRLTV